MHYITFCGWSYSVDLYEIYHAIFTLSCGSVLKFFDVLNKNKSKLLRHFVFKTFVFELTVSFFKKGIKANLSTILCEDTRIPLQYIVFNVSKNKLIIRFLGLYCFLYSIFTSWILLKFCSSLNSSNLQLEFLSANMSLAYVNNFKALM